MYFWNTAALKQKLATRPLTDAEAFPYYLAESLLIAFHPDASPPTPARPTAHHRDRAGVGGSGGFGVNPVSVQPDY